MLLPLGEAAAAICEAGVMVGEFQRIAHGMMMLGERPPRSVDEAVATGEKLSVMMMAAYLNSIGVAATAVKRKPARSSCRYLKPGSSRSSRDLMAQRWTDAPPPWVAAARTSLLLFWLPCSMHRSFGSGPTWMVFSQPIQGL
jgi:hypothetical protein